MGYSDTDLRAFMGEALRLARTAMTDGRGGPFGAVVVKEGTVIGAGGNGVVRGCDPTAHAEIMAIRAACRVLGTHTLAGCSLFSSCEPCAMCLAAVYWARLDQVWFAGTQDDAAEAGFDDAFIYHQMATPVEQRSIAMSQILRPEAQAIFAEWLAHPSKVPY